MASGIGGINNSRSFPLILDKEQLKRWWLTNPTLADCVEKRAVTIREPDAIKVLQIEEQGVAGKIRGAWDKVSLKVLPNLAKPSQIIGLLVTLIGICGCITAVSGFNIPGLEIILQNIPISIVFSMTLIRAGLHMINNGVMAGRLINRTRQETDQYYRLYQIENYVNGVEDKDVRLAEVHRRDQRLPEKYRLKHPLQKHQLYAKQHDDLPIIRGQNQDLKETFGYRFPELAPPKVDQKINFAMPEELNVRESTEHKPTLGDKWHDFWYKHLEKIGAVDMVLGQVMLFTALAGILFLAHPGIAPPGLDIIAHDPYLSVLFAVLLIGNWINCTRTGWRMLNYKKREEKRAAIEEDLKLIDAGLEIRHILEIHEWLQRAPDGVLKDKFLMLTERAKAAINRPPKLSKSTLDRFGKTVVPYLATPSIILGILIAFFGLACLGMSITDSVPDIFRFLTVNTPLSVLFASGIILVGFDGIYRGASISDLNKKETWKASSVDVRQKFLKGLYFPEIAEPGESKEAVNKEEVQGKIVSFGNTMAKNWYGLWFKSLKILWVPDGILGIFLITCSLMGLIIACGAPAPRSLDFMVKDPSFSGTFCVSMLGIGFDALNSSWRMLNYKNRKDDDKQDLKILKDCYKRLFPKNPNMIVRV